VRKLFFAIISFPRIESLTRIFSGVFNVRLNFKIRIIIIDIRIKNSLRRIPYCFFEIIDRLLAIDLLERLPWTTQNLSPHPGNFWLFLSTRGSRRTALSLHSIPRCLALPHISKAVTSRGVLALFASIARVESTNDHR